MTQMNELPPEFPLEAFKNVGQYLTPDFSAEDWKSLYEKGLAGDLTSLQMFDALVESKILPYLNPDDTITKPSTEQN